MHDIQINPFNAPLGAEVIGFDCGKKIEKKFFTTLHESFLEFGVLVFRNQNISPDQLVVFSRLWGKIKKHILVQYLKSGYPELLLISNKKGSEGNSLGIEDAGRYWHTDVSYEMNPPLASLLYALEVPKSGGDTLFASQYRSYDLLPVDLKKRLRSIDALHQFNYEEIQSKPGSKRKPLTQEQKDRLKGAIHPVIKIHPETGRKALYVNPGFTKKLLGVDKENSDVLLNVLFRYAVHTEVIYQHTWRQGDLIIWDNRCLMHRATPYDPLSIRHMYRSTVES